MDRGSDLGNWIPSRHHSSGPSPAAGSNIKDHRVAGVTATNRNRKRRTEAHTRDNAWLQQRGNRGSGSGVSTLRISLETKREGTALNTLLSRLKVVILICAISASVDAQAPVSAGWRDKTIEVEVKTDKVLYITGEPIRFTVLLVNKGTSPVYIAKNFYSSGGGIAGFSLSIRQTEGRTSPECVVIGDRFGDGAGPRSAKQILKEDFLWLAPGGIVGFTGQYQGCAVKHQGSYELTATYCPCDLNTSNAQAAAKVDGTKIITELIQSKPWSFRLQPKQQP